MYGVTFYTILCRILKLFVRWQWGRQIIYYIKPLSLAMLIERCRGITSTWMSRTIELTGSKHMSTSLSKNCKTGPLVRLKKYLGYFATPLLFELGSITNSHLGLYKSSASESTVQLH